MAGRTGELRELARGVAAERGQERVQVRARALRRADLPVGNNGVGIFICRNRSWQLVGLL